MIRLTNTPNGLNINPSLNNIIITGTNTISDVTFTGKVLGLTGETIGLENVDNTSDINKPISIATQNELNTKLPINNPIFTGKCIGPSVELENITINGMTKINILLCNFIKVKTDTTHILENQYTNITICGNDADTVSLPLIPIDGMTINIRNLSDNDLNIDSNKIMYNLLLAPGGLKQLSLQQNFMYTFIYNENLQNDGSWYVRF